MSADELDIQPQSPGPELSDLMPERREIKPVESEHFLRINGRSVYLRRSLFDQIQEQSGGISGPYNSDRQSMKFDVPDRLAPFREQVHSLQPEGEMMVMFNGEKYKVEDLFGRYHWMNGGLVYFDPEGGIHAGFQTQENIRALEEAGYRMNSAIPVFINSDSVLADQVGDKIIEDESWKRVVEEGKKKYLAELEAKRKLAELEEHSQQS